MGAKLLLSHTALFENQFTPFTSFQALTSALRCAEIYLSSVFIRISSVSWPPLLPAKSKYTIKIRSSQFGNPLVIITLIIHYYYINYSLLLH